METSGVQIQSIVDSLRATFRTGKSKPYEFRIQQLKALRNLVTENEEAIIAALKTDLGRSDFDAVVLEVLSIVTDLDYIASNLWSWMQPHGTAIPSLLAVGSNSIVYEPYGVALIIGAFNYPIDLVISPLVGAICAGNVAVVKPSEMASACEAFLVQTIPKYLDNTCYQVVSGGIETTQSLLSMKWDKIFFTGSTRVGKIIMKAAAENLTPVSLELGGKSPTIIGEHIGDLRLVTQRLLWGKCCNSGQTCIAPDYVICHAKHHDAFLKMCKEVLEEFFGNDVRANGEFGRIISQGHAHRLQAMIEEVRGNDPSSGEPYIVLGGEADVSEKYIAPTIIANATMTMKAMQEEIFGPVLPVMKFNSEAELLDIMYQHEKPLAMYIFSNDSAFYNRISSTFTSGAVVMNDTMMHFANSHSPFGGVGSSGLGGYHGWYSFKCFSHEKTVLYRNDWKMLDLAKLRNFNQHSKKVLSFFRFVAALGVDIPPWQSIRKAGAQLVFLGCVIVGTWAITKHGNVPK